MMKDPMRMNFRTPPLRCRLGGLQIADFIKFIIAFGFGVVSKSLYESRYVSHSVSNVPVSCPSSEPGDLLRADLPQQLREQYKPRSMYEVLRYEYFNSTIRIDNMDCLPTSGLHGHLRNDLKDILHQTLALFNSAKSERWTAYKLNNGYRRFDPARGEEYLLDVVLETVINDEKRRENHRFELVKPFGTPQLISDTLYDKNGKMIHFILPISGMSQKFAAFMKRFEEVCLKNSEHVYLLIVSFISEDEKGRKTGEEIRSLISKITHKHRKAHIRIIQTYKAFSRALGIDLGAKQLPPETLMFFCDVDVKFTRDFLNRCRLNAAQGRQVYYPILFAQYKPEIAKKYSPSDKIQNLEALNPHTGQWVHYGYGMACMYNMDYREVGGFNVNIKGWGGEDVDLFKKHVDSDVKIIRAMDPGLMHIYHDKHCNPALSEDQLRMCQGSMSQGLAAKSQLALLVLSQNITLVS